MKKYQLGLLILSLAAGLSLLCHRYTVNTVSRTDGLLENTLHYVEQERFSQAQEELDVLLEAFSHRVDIMAMYTSHTRLDDISAGLSRLQGYVDNQSVNDSVAEIIALRTKLEIIREEEELRLCNIL